MTSQITSLTSVIQPFIQAQIKENIKASRYWPCENSPVTGESPHKGPVTRKMFPFDDVTMICVPHQS